MLAGRYRVVAPLGRGGMGEIYRAEDVKLGQAVALKFLRSGLAHDPLLLERLLAEVRIGREVSHPNVCRLYDVVEFEGRQFITMEYVDGEDLASLLSRIGRLPEGKAFDLARDLCAGLAAVHDKGVVHRDLKPANVMIDGRGRARLTDFGLAVPQDRAQSETFAGTPAYMSPEQLAGGEATQRSDLYALGLVLYEMFTGKPFYEARTLGELRLQHREPKAPRLASSGLRSDPYERFVLQCLEEEPAARPASVRAVAALLPGGDPLEAAVAAGETPSPELVVAASRAGDLAALPALAALVLTLAGMVGAAWLVDRTSLLGLAPPPRSPELLVESSKRILGRLGVEPPDDAAFSFEWDRAFVAYRRTLEPAARWQKLDEAHPGPWRFFYRTSPRKLVAANRDASVRADDPPLDLSGMTRLVLGADGRLTGFAAVPPQLEESRGSWPAPDWRPLFEEAGLDPALFRKAAPRWAAPVDSDQKEAWEGELPGEAQPLRIEAAAYHGRPVWFEVQPPWAQPERMDASREPETRVPVGSVGLVILALAMPLGGVLLARRNLRLGRGDRAGASKVALVVFAAYALARLFQADHVASFGQELWILIKVLAYPAFWAGLVWLLYMALEPYARRRWPHVLIGWKRALAGLWSDPLVGRDLLLGALTGVGLCVLYHQTLLESAWFGMPYVEPVTNISGATISELRHVVFRVFVNLYGAVLYGLVFLFMLVLLRVLLRNSWLAAIAWCLLLAGPITDENGTVAWVAGALRALALFATITTGGLLRMVVALFCLFSLIEAPLTLDLSAWYAPRALPIVLAIAAIAYYGFRTALAGKPVLGRLLDE
jgi:serine/threonine-protein kinase